MAHVPIDCVPSTPSTRPFQEPIIPSRRTSVSTLALLGILPFASCAPPARPLTLADAQDSLSIDRFLAHMAALSSDDMAGRRPGTAGYEAAADYVIQESRDLGLEPGGIDGTYRQPIRFRTSRVAPSTPAFTVAGTALDFGADFSLVPRVMTTTTDVQAPLVFAGFGISAPDLGYDDFTQVDVTGKLVVVLNGAPEHFGSLERTVLSSSKVRDVELMNRGAVGVIVVQASDAPVAPARPRTAYLPLEAADESVQVSDEELEVAMTVPRHVAAAWMTGAGRSFDDVQASIRRGEPTSFDLAVPGRVAARFIHESFESANVAALLRGTDPEFVDEYLVVTAHLDHLGIGSPIEGDSIYNGTLDNASGSAALLTAASVLTRMETPRRSILFLWVTAEESGMLGSEYFARFPTVSPGHVVANQNIDGVMGMIAAATDVLAFGYEHSNLSDAVDFAVTRTGTPVSPDPTPDQNLFIRSDQYAFVRQGIPAIWVQAGRSSVDPAVDAQGELDRWIVERYHRPTDDVEQPVDLGGIRAELRNNLLVTWHIANEMEEIRWDEESFLGRRWAPN